MTRFTLEGTPEDSKALVVTVVTPMHAAPADYTLEVEPAPTAVAESPRPKSEKVEKVAALDRARAESVEARKREAQQQTQSESARKAAETERAARCRNGNRLISRATRPGGDERFGFCDDTTVWRTSDGRWKVAMALKGEDYERFTSRERATMEVAEHNARVLNTDEWRMRSGQARAAFETRVRAFVAKHRWPEARYLDEAKRSTLPATAE